MRTFSGIILAVLLAVPAAALASDTATFGQRILSVGDSVAKVYQVAGQPDRVVQLQNKFGAGVGQRLEYFIGDKVVQVTVHGSRVVRIDDIY